MRVVSSPGRRLSRWDVASRVNDLTPAKTTSALAAHALARGGLRDSPEVTMVRDGANPGACDMANKKQAAWDNYANQRNPTHPAYHQSRGASVDEAQQLAAAMRDAMSQQAAANQRVADRVAPASNARQKTSK